MAHIAIPIPSVPGKQEIEIEVSINGQKQALHYRVELFYWADCPVPTVDRVYPDRVECLRYLLSAYDQDWTLYFIGTPTEEFVPIAFVKKEDLAAQRRWRELA